MRLATATSTQADVGERAAAGVVASMPTTTPARALSADGPPPQLGRARSPSWSTTTELPPRAMEAYGDGQGVVGLAPAERERAQELGALAQRARDDADLLGGRDREAPDGRA
jgi:hypothetical protein